MNEQRTRCSNPVGAHVCIGYMCTVCERADADEYAERLRLQLGDSGARIAELESQVSALRAAVRNALPYLISCIHEIACEDEDHDGEPCPAETEDEPVKRLRQAMRGSGGL